MEIRAWSKQYWSHLISMFVFALLPFDCVSVQTGHHQRGRSAIHGGLRLACRGLLLLLSTGSRFKPLGHFCFLPTDCWQGVKKPSRINWVPLPVIRRCFRDIFRSRVFGQLHSGLFKGCLVGQVGDSGLFTRQRVSVFLWQGGFRTVCWRGIGGVA